MRQVLAIVFTPFGRADRGLYLIGYGFLTVISAVLTLALQLVVGGLFKHAPIAMTWFAPALLYVWCAYCLIANRLHDLGQSGAWALGPIALALLYSVATVAGGPLTPGALIYLMIAAAVVFSVYGVFALVLLLFAGDPGPNKFGARPAPSLG
ncbi:MAG TPA: DUF805 domain-containing protein [Caulobacterales bacterium]|nr:DUF805 domain-containing protein [Caulobacterales bacterium]